MNPTFDAFLRSWPFEPWLLARCCAGGRSSICAAGSCCIAATRGRWPAAPPRRVSRAVCCALPGARLADRTVHVAAPASPHAAAPVADDGRAAPALAGCSGVSVAARAAASDSHVLGLPLLRSAVLASALRAARPIRCRPGCSSRRPPGLAPAADLRARPGFRRLALSPARLFSRHRAFILVSGHPAVSQPAALVALAARSLPDPGRRAEHAAVRLC